MNSFTRASIVFSQIFNFLLSTYPGAAIRNKHGGAVEREESEDGQTSAKGISSHCVSIEKFKCVPVDVLVCPKVFQKPFRCHCRFRLHPRHANLEFDFGAFGGSRIKKEGQRKRVSSFIVFSVVISRLLVVGSFRHG